MRLTPKILLTVTLTIGLVYGGASYYLGEKSREVMTIEIDNYLASILEHAHHSVEQRQESVSLTSAAIASSRTVERSLNLNESRRVIQEINDAVLIYPYFNYILIANPEGDIFASTTRDRAGNEIDGELLLGVNATKHPLFGQHSSGEAFISPSGEDPFLKILGLPEEAAQLYIYPIYREGDFIGSVIISYDWAGEIKQLLSHIQENLSETENPTKSIVITDVNNQILAAVGELRFEADEGEDFTPVKDDLWRSIILEEEYDQSYSLIIINDRELTFAPVTNLQNVMFAWTIAGMVGLIFLLFLFSRRFLINRISSLVRGTVELKSGNLDYRIKDPYQDELGSLASAFNDMSFQLQHTTVSRNEVDGILQSMTSALFVVSMDNKIKSINLATTQLLALSENVILGKNIHRYLQLGTVGEDNGICDDAMKLLDHLSNDGETYKLIPSQGDNVPVLLSGSLMRDTSDRVTGAVFIATDITERLKLEKVKDDFLSTMSHELRSPLSSILGYCDLLKSEDLNSAAKTYLDNVQTAGRHLLRLIGDILDFSKIEAGNMILEKIPFSIREVSEETISTLLIKAREENSQLVIDIDPKTPMTVLGDPTRFRQIIMNFLSNALKFTNNGTVTLKVESSIEEPEHVGLKVSVTDTGVGISEEKIDKLFKTFSQVDSTITRHYGGTGLGLSISKQLVEAMNGSVGVESTEGEGSTFWFKIRLPISEQKIEIESPQEDYDIPPLNILLVEDIELNRTMARLILERGGHKIQEASNGLEALDLATHKSFDVVLMDIHMPEMDGVDATKAIRRHNDRKRANIPIIALTADVAVHNIDYYFSVGMNGYVSKPIDFKLLNKQFHKLGLASTSPYQDNTAGNGLPMDVPLVNLETFQDTMELVPESMNIFQQEAERYLETSWASHAASDWKQYHHEVNALKNLALGIGFSQLGGLCNKAEESAKNPRHTAKPNIMAQRIKAIEDCISDSLAFVTQKVDQEPTPKKSEIIKEEKEEEITETVRVQKVTVS